MCVCVFVCVCVCVSVCLSVCLSVSVSVSGQVLRTLLCGQQTPHKHPREHAKCKLTKLMCFVVQIKEVAPNTADSKATAKFWKNDIPVSATNRGFFVTCAF